jgi:hypothetical protein
LSRQRTITVYHYDGTYHSTDIDWELNKRVIAVFPAPPPWIVDDSYMIPPRTLIRGTIVKMSLEHPYRIELPGTPAFVVWCRPWRKGVMPGMTSRLMRLRKPTREEMVMLDVMLG